VSDDRCRTVRVCGRPYGHRGQHGGFRLPEQLPHRLSPRQYEAMRERALGWTWSRIEAEMGISRNTLSIHIAEAKARYEAIDETDVWRALGWLRVPEAA
jgi:DNA-binding NarL/FixJ family response regulator